MFDSTFCDLFSSGTSIVGMQRGQEKEAKKRRKLFILRAFCTFCCTTVVAVRWREIQSVRLRHHRSWLHREVSPLISALVNILHRYRQDRWEVRKRSLSLLMNYRACESQFRSSYPAVVSCEENVIWTSTQWRKRDAKLEKRGKSKRKRNTFIVGLRKIF